MEANESAAGLLQTGNQGFVSYGGNGVISVFCLERDTNQLRRTNRFRAGGYLSASGAFDASSCVLAVAVQESSFDERGLYEEGKNPIKLFRIPDGKHLGTIEPEGAEKRIFDDCTEILCVEICRTMDRVVFSGSRNGTVRAFDYSTGKQIYVDTSAHDGWVTSMTHSTSEQLIFSGSDDRTVNFYDIRSELRCVNRVHEDTTVTTVFSHEKHHLLATSSDTGRISVWDIRQLSRRVLQILDPDVKVWHWVTSGCFVENPDVIATTCARICRCWDMKGKKKWIHSETKTFVRRHQINCCAFYSNFDADNYCPFAGDDESERIRFRFAHPLCSATRIRLLGTSAVVFFPSYL